MDRIKVSSASPYEDIFGFSRGIRVGNTIHISGTGPIAPDGSSVGPGDAYLQAKRCLEIITHALEEAGGDIAQVVRTRIYITDVSVQDDVGRAHGEIFSQIKPAATMVVVKGLVRDEWLVEIEAEAIVD